MTYFQSTSSTNSAAAIGTGKTEGKSKVQKFQYLESKNCFFSQTKSISCNLSKASFYKDWETSFKLTIDFNTCSFS